MGCWLDLGLPLGLGCWPWGMENKEDLKKKGRFEIRGPGCLGDRGGHSTGVQGAPDVCGAFPRRWHDNVHHRARAPPTTRHVHTLDAKTRREDGDAHDCVSPVNGWLILSASDPERGGLKQATYFEVGGLVVGKKLSEHFGQVSDPKANVLRKCLSR